MGLWFYLGFAKYGEKDGGQNIKNGGIIEIRLYEREKEK